MINYPRYGRTGWKRYVPSWKLVSSIVGLGFLTMIILFIWAYASTTIPSQDARVAAQTTIIYYSDGTTEIGRLSTQNRVNVQLGQVPKQVQSAVLAAEDHTFYQNSGVDPKSLVRAAWSNLRGNATQGGSTITQQYVKNVYDLRDRSVQRKAKEFFIALKINRTVDKSQILERYLNTIYMGRGAYGLQAATEAYFGKGKSVKDLTVSQGAFLAGLINAPSLADPADGGKDRAVRRWNVVLDAMVKDGDLDPATRAKQVFPQVKPTASSSSLSGQKGYMIELAKQSAAQELGISKDEVATGGYAIVTTFQQKLVKKADTAVKQQLLSIKGKPAGMHAALVTIDPKTGAVRAMYGGPNYLNQQFNDAFQGTAQAGSTFKPFGLIAALEDNVSLKSRFSGSSPMTFPDAKKPIKNFGNESLRTMNLIDATAHSVNTIYVALNQEVGPDKTQKAAWAAGIPKSAGVEDNLVNVLGSANPHPVDMANAYATFASGGIRHNWYVVQSIGTVSNHKLASKYDHTKTGAQNGPVKVFDERHVRDLTYAMRQVVQRGSGSYAQALNREVAGKTGTSSDSRSAWFVGFTPQYSTAVAIWQENSAGNQVSMKGFGGFRNITGGSFPVRIWTEYMKQALDGKDKIDFQGPVYDGEFTGTPIPTPVFTTAAPTTTPEPNPTATNPEPTVSASIPAPTRTRIKPTFPGKTPKP